MTPNDWLDFGSKLINLGVAGFLIFAFATNRLRTRGQADAELARQQKEHDDRVADINAANERARADREAFFVESKAEAGKQYITLTEALGRHFNDLHAVDVARQEETEKSLEYWRDGYDTQRQGRELAEARLIEIGAEAARVAKIATQAAASVPEGTA